jgi:hypothetical protein
VLNKPNERPFDEVQELGAVITLSEPDQCHVGFLYKLGEQPARMVHLAWHFILRDHEATPEYRWVQSGLDQTARRNTVHLTIYKP